MARIASFADLGCLVTGASSGIGRDIALELARRGARLVVTARREERLHALVRACRDLGSPGAWALPMDLGDRAVPARLARLAANHLGHVDVLVNNAGFAVPGAFVQADLERTLAMIRVNLLAVVDLTHRLLPGMLVRDRGGVLNVASLSGYQGTPFQGTYGGTKAFLLQWSNALHMEVAHTHVAITALCPGVTDTEFFEAAGYRHLGRFMERRMPSARVARAGLAALSRGRMEVVPGALNKAVVAVQRLVPRRFTVAMARRILGGRVRAPRRSPGRASR